MELIKQKRKLSTNSMLSILFLLMMGDYLLTYLSMYVFGVAEEANYLMVWLMELPFWKGFIIRIFVVLGPVVLLKFAEKYKNPGVYRKILLVPLATQVVPYVAHGIWVWKYLKFSSYIS